MHHFRHSDSRLLPLRDVASDLLEEKAPQAAGLKYHREITSVQCSLISFLLLKDFSRVHATLYVTMSVRRSVQNHFAFFHFFRRLEVKEDQI